MTEATAVALRGESMPIPQPANETAAIFSMIERAARDPAVDVDKLERLMAMAERMQASRAKGAYAAALAAMQPEIPAIVERGKIKVGNDVRSTYALWEDINEAIKPILARHGFALSFRTQTGDKIVVTGVLSHRDGHSEETTMTLPVDASGSKNAVQAIGSSVSYGKRYTAGALLNMTSRGEDDDGKAAGIATHRITQDQADKMRDLLEANGKSRAAFLKWAKVEKIEDIAAEFYDSCVAAIKQKAPA